MEELLDLGQGPDQSSTASIVEQPPPPPPPPREEETATVPAAPSLNQPAKATGNDEDLLGLMTHLRTDEPSSNSALFNGATAVAPPSDLSSIAQPPTSQQQPSVDDLLTNGSPVSENASAALINTILSSSSGTAKPGGALQVKMEDAKASRRRGLDALDMLGESAIKTHLSGTARSPQFEARRNEKMPIAMLQEKQRQEQQQVMAQALQPLLAAADAKQPTTSSAPKPPGAPVQVKSTAASQEKSEPSAVVPNNNNNNGLQHSKQDTPSSISNVPTKPPQSATTAASEVKLADLDVPLSSIKPGSTPPLTILGDGDDASMSIVLHFGRDRPREHVTAVVITMINKTPEPLSDFELRCAVEPRTCRVKLQPPSGNQLPAHNPFVPPAAVTQVMLVSNPKEERPVSLKYVVSYRTPDGETQTDMGEVKELPI